MEKQEPIKDSVRKDIYTVRREWMELFSGTFKWSCGETESFNFTDLSKA